MLKINRPCSLRQFANWAKSSKEAVRNAITNGKLQAIRLDSVWILSQDEVGIFRKQRRKYPRYIKRRQS